MRVQQVQALSHTIGQQHQAQALQAQHRIQLYRMLQQLIVEHTV